MNPFDATPDRAPRRPPREDDARDPRGVIQARPVDMATVAAEAGRAAPFDEGDPVIPWPAREPPPPSRRRALLELLLLPPVVIGSAVGLMHLIGLLTIEDHRWANIALTTSTGFVGLLVVMAMLAAGGEPLRSIGWTSSAFWLNAGIGVAALVLFYVAAVSVMLAVVLVYPDLLYQEPESVQAIQETFPPMTLMQVLALTTFVAIWEEVIFRGFLLTRLKRLFGNWWLAIPASAVLFALGHGYQGVLAMVITGILGVILGVLFVWRKSLVPCIVYHTIHNTVAFALMRFVAPEW